jgi:hypothetical protein
MFPCINDVGNEMVSDNGAQGEWPNGQLPINWAMKGGMKIVRNVKMLQQQLLLLQFGIFSHTKNTQKFPKGEREKKKAPTPNIVLSSCANGMGQKLHRRKVCNGRFFSFHNGCCPLCAPSPKKEKYPQHWICIFICIFVYLIFQWILSIYAQKDKK